MKISSSDECYLTRQIRLGQGLLVLGAGASAGSLNRRGRPIKSGYHLARTLCEEAGLPFNDEALPTVYEAVRGARLSDAQIQKLLKDEYCETTASNELASLFNVCWRRLYTFNIDDALESIPVLRSGQRRRYYNGLIDRVADFDGPLNLQIIYLHGQASKPEHGLIFSESEYAKALKNEALFWYNRAGQDYLSCPIFIGSKLDEPILWAQIERAKRTENSSSGLGFVITPSAVTEIQAQSLRNKGLVHVKSNLEEFVSWLKKSFKMELVPLIS